MASKKGGIQNMGKDQTPSLAGVVLKMIAIGFAGGAALIAGADKAGKAIVKAGSKKESKED